MASRDLLQEALDLEQRGEIVTGPLLPLLSPKPVRRQLPILPKRPDGVPALGDQRADWTCDTFILPAAFPRSIRNSTQPVAKQQQQQQQQHQAAAQQDTPRVKVDAKLAFKTMMEEQVSSRANPVTIDDKLELDAQEQLLLTVNRYRPRQARDEGPRGLTLVFAHANGFHKEIWEPTIADLLDELDDWSKAKALPVDEVWALDAVNQGDAGLLNEPVLGIAFDWCDHGRDILNFVASYLDSPAANVGSTTSLPRLDTDARVLACKDAPISDSSNVKPSSRVWRDRIIVGIGHSLGAAGVGFAASAAPSLFSSIIFCDPVMPPPEVRRSVSPLTTGALIRRDEWKTHQEAREGFLKKDFFRQWDTRVLERYCQQGLKQVKNGVALKTRAIDEARTFCDPFGRGSKRAHNRLSMIPSDLPAHFIFAEEGKSVLPEEAIALLVKKIPHATKTRIAEVGHLIAQEKPRETAQAIGDVLRRWYPQTESAKL